MSIGFTTPFQASSGSLGYFDVTETEVEAAKQNIRSLLITNWGERPMHYDFGCNMIEFLFEQSRDEELKPRIADRIQAQTARWLPFLKLDTLNILFSADDSSVQENGMLVVVGFKFVNRPDLGGTLKQSFPS